MLYVLASEGTQCRRPEDAEGLRIPRRGGEGAMFEGEDERNRQPGMFRSVLGDLISEGDGVSIFFPAGVPGAEMFLVPLLLDKRGAVGGEVDEDDAMDFGGDASAAGVEAFEVFGVRTEDESGSKSRGGDEAMRYAHRGMLPEVMGAGELPSTAMRLR